MAWRGILTGAAAIWAMFLPIVAPFTLDTSAWFFWRGAVLALITVVVIVWSFVHAAGTQPLFSGAAVLEE